MRPYLLRTVLFTGLFFIGLQSKTLTSSVLEYSNLLNVLGESFSVLSKDQLYNQAHLITAKVLSQENGSWGSGILIQHQGSVYTLLTNAHVVSREGSYKVKLHDGQEYDVQKLEVSQGFQGNDLILLQFETTDNYPIASLRAISSLTEGDEVFAAGYPYQQQDSDSTEFTLLPGYITFFGLKQPLMGGYEVGTSNNFQKGMSGGALLNHQGEVVGVNGMHRHLFGTCPYRYRDGSAVDCSDLPKELPRSWTIPIEKVVAQIPCQLDISLVNPNPGINFHWYEGLKDSSTAARLLQPAPQSLEQWDLVVCHWEKAIEHMKAIPSTSNFYSRAQSQIEKYQDNLNYAQQQLENLKQEEAASQ